jgi:acyl-coenzyme A thioesterase PaaI-like protein
MMPAETTFEGSQNPRDESPSQKPVQDYYPDGWNICYGCGRMNDHGLHIKTYWDADETVCTFYPKPYHTAITGFVYGGLIASVIDCHSTGSAAAATYRAEGRAMDTDPPLRFVTASLHVEYLRPTPIDGPMELRSQIKEIKGRKVVVTTALSVHGQVCATGEVVAVRISDDFGSS